MAATCSLVTTVSSTTSCKSEAAIVARSISSSAKISAAAKRVFDVGDARGAPLLAVRLIGHIVDAPKPRTVQRRIVLLDFSD